MFFQKDLKIIFITTLSFFTVKNVQECIFAWCFLLIANLLAPLYSKYTFNFVASIVITY